MKTAKKRALVDLLTELKELGIDYHMAGLDKLLKAKVLFEQPPV